jgi:hypothetical protein
MIWLTMKRGALLQQLGEAPRGVCFIKSGQVSVIDWEYGFRSRTIRLRLSRGCASSILVRRASWVESVNLD